MNRLIGRLTRTHATTTSYIAYPVRRRWARTHPIPLRSRAIRAELGFKTWIYTYPTAHALNAVVVPSISMNWPNTSTDWVL